LKDEQLVKTVMLGIVKGDWPGGRPARRWSDDILQPTSAAIHCRGCPIGIEH